nr:MAG TPA: hypothetical protein [Crassvirales sp.]
MCTGNYPLGAEYDKDAPWNEKEDLTTIEVCVSLCVSKSLSIPISSRDLEGDPEYVDNYLYDAVEQKIKEEIKDKQWIIDNLEIIKE